MQCPVVSGNGTLKLERIQILRLAAAGAVAYFHAVGTLGTRLSIPASMHIFEYGYLGVDLFFVISGFIIYLTIRSRETSWAIFLKRRVLRVVPLYWLTTIAMFGLLQIFGRGAVPSGEMLARSLFFLSWTDHVGASPVIYLGWSLEYEMFFYLAITTAMVQFRDPTRVACIVFSVLVLAAVLSGVDQATMPIHFFFNPMLLEFTYGLLAGKALFTRRIPWLELAFVAPTALIAVTTTWGLRVGTAGLAAAFIVLAAAIFDARAPLQGRVLRMLAKLGDASYSMYLSQAFTISALTRIGAMGAPYLPFEAIATAIAASCLAIGWLLYRLVEYPAQRVLRP